MTWLLLFIVLLLVDLYRLGRTLLLLIGRLKGYVLNLIGRYGEEPFFYPLSTLLFSLIRIIILAFLISRMNLPLFFLLILFLVLDSLQPVLFPSAKKRFPRQTQELLKILAYYPFWYRELLSRTSRYERRRIAYMWLRMPSTTRSGFEIHTDSFLQWADLIIMGSVMEEDRVERSQYPEIIRFMR